MNLIHLPVALHLRLFGAAGLGYIVGRVDTQPTYLTLAIACTSFVATIAGWTIMRPMMRNAKLAIAQAGKSDPTSGDKNDIDS